MSTITTNAAFARYNKQRAMPVIVEMSSKKASDLRNSTKRGLEYMNRAMSQQKQAMERANRAFDAVNAAANKFK